MRYNGNGFTLRPYEKGDEAFIAKHANNINIWKTLRDRFPYPYTYDDAVTWVNFISQQKVVSNFVIVVNDEPCGSIGLESQTDIFKKNMEIGFWLSELHWGKGITTEAVAWLTDYAFSNFEINRIWGGVFSNNPASGKVLLKNGFLHEATLKQAIFKNQAYYDELIYARLRLK